MVTMPGPEDLRPRLPGASRGQPRYPGGSPVADALQGVGNTIANIGFNVAERERTDADKTQSLGVQSRFLQFEDQWSKASIERAQGVQPGAAGFSTSLQKDYSTAAKEFFKSIPDDLKPVYDQRLFDLESRLTDGANKFEREELDRFSKAQIEEGQNVLLSRQAADPSRWQEVENEGLELNRNRPGRSGIEGDIEDRAWRKRRAMALFQTRRALDEAERYKLGVGTAPGAVGSVVDRIIQVESGGNPNAKASTSSAKGLGQFTKATWASFLAARHPELLRSPRDFRSDPALSREATEWYATENAANLKAKGLPVTAGTVYLSHFLGPQGAVDMLSANQMRTAASVNPAAASANRTIFYGKDGSPKSAADIIAWAERKMGGASAPTDTGGTGPDTSILSDPAPEYAVLDFEDRLGLFEKSLADEKARQRELQADLAVRQKQYERGAEDYILSLRDGRSGSDPDYSPEMIVANASPERVAIIQEQIDAARSFGEDKAALSFASPDEVNAIMAERAAAMETPENYKQERQDFAGLTETLKARNTAIVADPAAYVAQQPSVGAAYQRMAEAPTDVGAARAYAVATLAEQERLGVPLDARRILSKQDQARIAASFADQSEGSQNAAVLMRMLEAQWGKDWPKVFGELAASKALPGTALVIGAMNRPDQAIAAEELAVASMIGTTELEKTITSDAKKIVEEGVQTAMDKFAGTLTSNGRSGVETFLTFREGVYQLALSYARKEDSAAAVTRAYNDVLGKKYSIHETFRVPVEEDGDTIADNAGSMIGRLTGEGIALPFSDLPAEHVRDSYLDALKARGYFVTNGDETGLTLFDETGTAVMTPEGKPLTFTWAEIRDSSKVLNLSQRGKPVIVAPPQPRGDEYDQQLLRQRQSEIDRLGEEAVRQSQGLANDMVEPGNIDLDARKVLQNADGSISTEQSVSVNIDGVEVLLPTVIDGKKVFLEEAIEHYRKTGEHLGKFKTPEAADAYAESLHKRQEKKYKPAVDTREAPAVGAQKYFLGEDFPRTYMGGDPNKKSSWAP